MESYRARDLFHVISPQLTNFGHHNQVASSSPTSHHHQPFCPTQRHPPVSVTKATHSTPVAGLLRQRLPHTPSLRRIIAHRTRSQKGRAGSTERVATTTRAWAGFEEDSRYRDSFIVFFFYLLSIIASL